MSYVDDMLAHDYTRKALASNDIVEHPSHYCTGKIEVIDFIEDQNLNYHLGNAIKYICRCEHKGNKTTDLEKAMWYLKREIERGNK